MSSCNLLVRSNQGIFLLEGKSLDNNLLSYPADKTNPWHSCAVSPNGEYYALAGNSKVLVYSSSDSKLLYEIERYKVSCLTFSPKSNILVTGATYASYNNQPPQPNVNIHSSQDGKHLAEFLEKNVNFWKPFWTKDEHLCVRFTNGELHFYEDNDFTIVKTKFHHHKVTEFSMSLAGPPYLLATYLQGKKGQPSFVKIYRYPIFDAMSVVASKSFFKSDRVAFQWNPKGTELTFIVSTDVDKTGSSYYGEQFLCFVNSKGDASNMQLSKDGPIHNVSWNPNGKEFCVIYGFTPSKATLFNSKGEPTFDFGTGSRNTIHYNPFGNLLLLGGFGNLSGDVEIWDAAAKKIISNFKARDTTFVTWDPTGEFILTATLTPRLRICNGIRLWHHTGSLQYEKIMPEGVEFWQVEWFGKPEGILKPPVILKKPTAGIELKQPVASQQAYRPPGARNKPAMVQSLHEEEIEPPSSIKKNMNQGTKLTKNALRNKKKQEKKPQVKPELTSNHIASPTSPMITPRENNPENRFEADDPEKNKQIRKLMTKLSDIKKLKELQNQGKQLELNQIAKLKKEQELLDELEKLKL